MGNYIQAILQRMRMVSINHVIRMVNYYHVQKIIFITIKNKILWDFKTLI